MAGPRPQTLSSMKVWNQNKRQRASIPGMSGIDEVESGEHLTNGATVAAAKWSVTNDLKNADGDANVTITDNTETLAAFLGAGGELETPPQLISAVDSVMTEGQEHWTNVGYTSYADTGGHIWTLADAITDYMSLAAQYAPMVEGTEYKMTLDADASGTFVGSFVFQDADGNFLFNVIAKGNAQEHTFTYAPTTGAKVGGFRVKAGTSNANCQWWDNFLLSPTASTVPAVGLVYRVLADGDTTGNDHYTAKGDVAPAANDLFAITVFGGGNDAIVYIGNAVGGYAWSANQTSALTQTAANRTTAGINAKGKALKEYQLTYTIAIAEAIAPAGTLALTVETFAGESTTMPITAGSHAVYFQASADAPTDDFVIQAVATGATAGVLSISALTLMRCCDSGANPDAGEWVMIRPLEADATLSAVATVGDDLTSMTLAVLESDSSIRGRWTRIVPSSGRIAAYRL